jgi:polysaccharide pyruvyl transferase WcaK-like protein
MRIGLIGWYGHANLGDERILYCLKSVLSRHELIIIGDWGEARDQLAALNTCAYVLIGGGGLILRGCNRFADILERLSVPFSFIGISIEARHRDMELFLQVMKTKADRIIVRDAESLEILKRPANAEIGPDLTFIQPLPVVEPSTSDVWGLNLRPWYFWQAELHGGYHRFMRKLSRLAPFVESMYPLTKWQPDLFVAAMESRVEVLRPLPFYFEAGFHNDYNLLSHYYRSVPGAMEELDFRRLRYLLGMRFHSIVFAVQMGIPFLSLSYQPKNENFCKDMGLSVLSVDIFQWRREIDAKLSLLRDNYVTIREKLLDHRQRYSAKTKQVINDFKLHTGL